MKTDHNQFFRFRELGLKYSPGRKNESMRCSSLLHLALFRLRLSE